MTLSHRIPLPELRLDPGKVVLTLVDLLLGREERLSLGRKDGLPEKKILIAMDSYLYILN